METAPEYPYPVPSVCFGFLSYPSSHTHIPRYQPYRTGLQSSGLQGRLQNVMRGNQCAASRHVLLGRHRTAASVRQVRETPDAEVRRKAILCGPTSLSWPADAGLHSLQYYYSSFFEIGDSK